MRIEKLDQNEITMSLCEDELKNIANAMFKGISKSNETEKKQFEDAYGKIMFACDMLLTGFPSEQSLTMLKAEKAQAKQTDKEN